MELVGVSSQKIKIFNEMLSYDSQGLYLKGDISHAEAFDNILEMSSNCGLSPSAFYSLFATFHLIDAASYPSLKSLFQIENATIKHISANQEKIDLLTGSLKGIEIGRTFFLIS